MKYQKHIKVQLWLLIVADEEKYKVVDVITQKFKELFEKKTKIAGKLISEILTY